MLTKKKVNKSIKMEKGNYFKEAKIDDKSENRNRPTISKRWGPCETTDICSELKVEAGKKDMGR